MFASQSIKILEEYIYIYFFKRPDGSTNCAANNNFKVLSQGSGHVLKRSWDTLPLGWTNPRRSRALGLIPMENVGRLDLNNNFAAGPVCVSPSLHGVSLPQGKYVIYQWHMGVLVPDRSYTN